jgi:TrmH family RNA methyltransferase
MEIIRSRQNPLVKQLIKLAESRRERLKTRQTLLLGTHLVDSALAAGWTLQRLLVAEGEDRRAEIAALMQQSSTPVTLLSRELFAEVEQSPSTVGILGLATLPETPVPRRTGCCLLLEGVQDPGNVGSILRTAAAAGADQVWLTPGCADVWSPKVLRAGMGAHFMIPLIERVALEEVLPGFNGRICVTTLDDADSLFAADLRADMVLALGSEGEGVSTELLKYADTKVRIPMARATESLNVAAAAAICLFERLRQLQPS